MWGRLLDLMLAGFIRRGTLTLHLPDGRMLQHGDGGTPRVTVHITDPAVVARLVRSVEIAVGEAYMDGTLTIENDDLHGLIELGVRNIQAGNFLAWQRLMARWRTGLRRLQQFNPAPRARRNVAHHYDLSGELYDLFLDADKQYSCGYFRTPDMSLEEAQRAKKAHIAAKLLLRPGARVLDIGCGWGGMALTLAREHQARVLGITLSAEQHKAATRRAAEAGLSDQVEFRLCDYRDVSGRFDRIVSVGMFEHVGTPHYRTYFRTVRELLEPDGVALIHTIGRTSPPGHTQPWISKYIFPGGYVPAMSEVAAALEKEGLWTTDVEVWRLHYAYTLNHWYRRFMANLDRARALYDDRFCRMWRYYLVACEQGFRYYNQCVFQFQLAREVGAVPLTRDYIYADRGDALKHAAE